MDTTYTIQQASKVAEVSPTTIRRWVTNGSLKASRNNKKWEISHQELHHFLVKSGRQGASKVESNDNEHGLYRLLLEEKTESLRLEREQNMELRNELKELRSEIKKMEIEIKTLLENKSGKGLKDIVSRWIRI